MLINRSSKLFQPIVALQKNTIITNDSISKSSQLMLNNGIIRQCSPGIFHFLPLGVRVLDKLIKVIDAELKRIDAHKVVFPTLTQSKLWKASGRYNDVTNELFKLRDRHNSEYILSPTHEEAAAELITSLGVQSYKKYPLKLYQITSKFRDEMKPRFGLMRARQFMMKDLYSFDIDTEAAQKTYSQLCQCYNRIFDQLALGWVKVLGASGTMGGNLSHEYHIPSVVGEDKLLQCSECKYSANLEYIQHTTNHDGDVLNCPSCQSANITITNGIEVGHTFLLGEKYSKALNSKYLAEDGKPKLLQMGSYGLGVSRIIAAAVEVLSDEQAIKWPAVLTPYKVVVIGPKRGSKEHAKLQMAPEDVYLRLNDVPRLRDDVLYDDRCELSIGKRVMEARRSGYPYALVLGRKGTENPPLLELLNLYTQEQSYLSIDAALDFFSMPTHQQQQQQYEKEIKTCV